MSSASHLHDHDHKHLEEHTHELPEFEPSDGIKTVIRLLSKALRLGFATAMGLSTGMAVAVTIKDMRDDDLGLLISMSICAGLLAFLDAVSLHGKFAAMNFRREYGAAYPDDHAHTHGAHKSDENAPPVDYEFLKNILLELIRLLQMFMTYCRLYVELGVIVMFFNMLHTGEEEEVFALSDAYGHVIAGLVYVLAFMMYDLFIITEETNEVMREALGFDHDHRGPKNYLVSLFLNTFGILYKLWAWWRNVFGYHLNIGGHTLIHFACVAELLEQLHVEREDLENPAIGTLVALGSALALYFIYVTTHYFEGLSLYFPHLYLTLGKEDEMPQAKSPGSLTKNILLFPLQLFYALADCLPASLDLLKKFIRLISFSIALWAVALFHGADAWVPVAEAAERFEFSKPLFGFLSAWAVIFASFGILWAECYNFRKACEKKDEAAEGLLSAEEGRSNYGTASTPAFNMKQQQEQDKHKAHDHAGHVANSNV